jgi:hypothetical protein
MSNPIGSLRLACGMLFLIGAFTADRSESATSDIALSIHLAQRASVVSAISISAPSVVNAAEGDSVKITATVGSGDPHSIMTLTVAGAPPGLSFTTNTPTFISPSATLSGVLGFQTAGVWLLQWYAYDQLGATDSATTQLIVADTPTESTFDADAFTSGGNGTIRIRSGKPQWCVQVEPRDGSFSLSEVDPASLTMTDASVYGGAPVVSISTDNVSFGGDRNRNGIEELTACVPRDDFPTLFGGDYGSSDAFLSTRGSLLTGGIFQATVSVRVIRSPGNTITSSISPNPLNRSSTLAFTTRRDGSVTARLFDIRGRYVATLFERRSLEPGPHRIPLTSLEGIRDRLASGVYLIRVTSEHDGSETKTVTILR